MSEVESKWLEELQIFIHTSLQKVISQAVEASENHDPFTVITLINQISEVYLENMKNEWLKLSENRKEYEAETAKDLEVLAQEI